MDTNALPGSARRAAGLRLSGTLAPLLLFVGGAGAFLLTPVEAHAPNRPLFTSLVALTGLVWLVVARLRLRRRGTAQVRQAG